MITELKSIPDIWKRMPSEMHARRFLDSHFLKKTRGVSFTACAWFCRRVSELERQDSLLVRH